MDAVQRRAALAAFLIALVTALIVASPALDAVRGWSIDILTALRWRAFGNSSLPSPSVVVALDEETFNTPPFEGTPSVTWTREIGRVLTAILDGGATVVDRDYLRALALGARAGKVVLGQVQHREHPVQPSPGQRAAVGFGANIRALNAYTDDDGVIRRVPLSFEVDGQRTPSMAVELVKRSIPPGADVVFAKKSGSVPNTLTLNFQGGADDIPTYSLADLRVCAEKGDQDFFRRQFAGKVVLIGTLLDVEDRKITSKRFATGPEGAHAERCALPKPAPGQTFRRDSIAGVYIHATAVSNLMRGNMLTEFGRIGTAIFSFALAALAAAAALALGPVTAAIAFLAIAAAWTAWATVALREALAIPLVEPVLAGLAALGATIGYRFVVSDRNKRLLRQSFALYLAPAVIERMMASNKPPALGGESRNITVYFSDIADFSAFAETIAPVELVAAMNEYLSNMTDIIEAHGGFVDKYIGDAIVAVFGAPLDDPDHATNAVRAALQCAAKLSELHRVAEAFQGHALRQRIGINTGEALVGNIGSRRRFNYTVMGDTVNLASRLEGANRFFGTTIMASEATKAAAGSAFVWREIDAIRVKGRAGTVTVFEPLAAGGVQPPQHVAAYAEGLGRFRDKDFAAAARAFARFADFDPPAAAFLIRARALAENPPGPGWEPVNALEEK